MPPPMKEDFPPDGMIWPLVPNSRKEGDRSTMSANKRAFCAATRAVDCPLSLEMLNEKKWRKTYTRHAYNHVVTCLESKDAAVACAQAGLDWMHHNFDFVKDGEEMSLAQAMTNVDDSFFTGFVRGTKPRPTSTVLEVPYKGEILTGKRLHDQVDKWVSHGTIEPSAGEAIKDVSLNDSWRDLSDKYFVLLGAGSAMGPLKFLLDLGANIIAIDLGRQHIWERLLSLAENSSGTMTFPIRVGRPQSGLKTMEELCEAAGANLLTQTPDILNWVKSICPDGPVVVGSYAYLDGELHVRLSLAMDAIVNGLIESRPDIIPAYLCTPTDIHVIPQAAHEAAQQQYSSLGFVNMLCRLTINGLGSLAVNAKKPVVAKDGSTFYLVDGLVKKQGPNYALAKRLQHWRAVVSRHTHGCRVSSNIAPSTATASVVSNKLFALAYGGMKFFKPMEVFQQETSNAVMGALLLRDVCDPATPSNPSLPLKNPLQLFSYGSFHGGVWRMAYTMNSIGTPAVLAYLLQYLGFLVLILLSVVCLGFVGIKIAKGENVVEDMQSLFKGEL